MKKFLRKVSLLFVALTISVVGLFGCDFFSTPKEEVTIMVDDNSYKTVTNLSSLLENVYKKMDVIQAFELEGGFSATSSIKAAFIAGDKIKDSALSLEYEEKGEYELKLNIRNKLLYFKVPFDALHIETTLNLGMKDNVDDFIEYLPLFAGALDIDEFISFSETEYRDLFNRLDYTDSLLDKFLYGDMEYSVENGIYRIVSNSEVEVLINRDFSIKSIKNLLREDCEVRFIYPRVGVYTLEYPSEIVGIGYVTRESLEESLGASFKTLLAK